MKNTNKPDIKIGLVVTSRDNFERGLSDGFIKNVYEQLLQSGFTGGEKGNVHLCSVIIESESDAVQAAREILGSHCDACAVILGNFGPEAPETIFAKLFGGPVMYAAAAEDSKDTLYAGRRDAYCGLLNCSYNLNLRGIKAWMAEYPVGDAAGVANMIREFMPIATAVTGLHNLKLITFGPRPRDFFACNAPIKGIYDLGVEVEENSELDLYLSWLDHAGDPRIAEITESMKKQLGSDKYADMYGKFAQYEVTLLDWAKTHTGSRKYVAFANKCWPAFSRAFGFLPCYVNSRLMDQGIPVGCETDMYGAVSEYIGLCIQDEPVTLLDMNNTVPSDLADNYGQKYGYRKEEMFIGFHCGNTSAGLLSACELKFKMNRKDPYAPETGKEMTKGTLEGVLKSGDICCYRLHAGADSSLQAYIAKGKILPETLDTYGCYAVFGIEEMGRFYRHVMLEKAFPHHCAVVYGDRAATLYEIFKYLGIPYIGHNQRKIKRYPDENPFV